MSFKRAAIRRERKEKERIMKSKAINADLLRAEQIGFENGKTISICIILDCLHELGWNVEKLQEYTESIMQQSLNTAPEIINIAIGPWQRVLEERIKEFGEMPRMVVNTTIKKIEYDSRNSSYINMCAFGFLNLYSNFNMNSNKKQTGKLDMVISECTKTFFEMMKEPQKYDSIECIKRTELLTGYTFT